MKNRSSIREQSLGGIKMTLPAWTQGEFSKDLAAVLEKHGLTGYFNCRVNYARGDGQMIEEVGFILEHTLPKQNESAK